ncbi:Armadillo-like helical [Penicillium atrosanguineum]|nr:Armadillo-like helical [Penicillium atrosanguineum]
MEQELLSLLANTQSSTTATRQAAELQLKSLYSNEAFPISLTAIASHESVPVNLRQSALSVLRTFIGAGWSSMLDEFKGQVLVNEVNKVQIRRALLELATTTDTPERKVKASASYAVSKIASADFPDDWPELLPSLLQIINDASTTDSALHGALKVLLDLVDTGLSEDQFFNVARDLVSALFAVATSETRRPMMRALSVAVFRSCFDTFEMVLEQHKVAIKQFVDELLSAWSPFFVSTLKAALPQPPSSEEANKSGEVASQWRGIIGLKIQVVKTLMKIRGVFPGLLTAQSPAYFSTVWDELTNALPIYQNFYIDDERQGRLEDVDGLPYSLDFLILEELDLIQTLLKAPPVKAELQQQLQNAGAAAGSSGWLVEIMKLSSSYAQITSEEEGLWDVDVNLFLSEETSVTANYTPEILQCLFADSSSSWKSREAALCVLNFLLRDFGEVSQDIPLELANHFTRFVNYALQQEEELLRARGYLAAGALARVAGQGFQQNTTSYLEATLKAIAEDPSEVVKVAAIRVLQDLVPSLPISVARPFQVTVINALSEFVSAHDLREQSDCDDLKVTLAETLRDTIMADSSVVLSSVAIDVLFNIASSGAENFQLTMTVTEAFEDIVDQITDHGPEAYMRLCEKVLPSLMGAIDVGNMTEENALTNFAADLLRALAERSSEPMPPGFVETVMPKLNRLLLDSTEAELIRPATEAVRHMLAHDFAQFVAWRDPQSGKEALEVVLVIIDRLLGPAVDDNAAVEVGQLAAELVEKAGSERLGPYLPQLLQAVAQRLATAQQAQFIQSLILVFARLTLISPREVVDFLAQVNLDGQSGLAVVLSKWLENSVNFAGYDEIKQNIFALARLYELSDPRLAEVPVKGDLIIQDTGRIKTRSQARTNPDRDDGDDDWEDVPGQVLDLGLGMTKQQLMSFGEGGTESVFGVRQRDDETQAFLTQFFQRAVAQPGFQDLYGALTEDEQAKLQSLG